MKNFKDIYILVLIFLSSCIKSNNYFLEENIECNSSRDIVFYAENLRKIGNNKLDYNRFHGDSFFYVDSECKYWYKNNTGPLSESIMEGQLDSNSIDDFLIVSGLSKLTPNNTKLGDLGESSSILYLSGNEIHIGNSQSNTNEVNDVVDFFQSYSNSSDSEVDYKYMLLSRQVMTEYPDEHINSISEWVFAASLLSNPIEELSLVCPSDEKEISKEEYENIVNEYDRNNIKVTSGGDVYVVNVRKTFKQEPKINNLIYSSDCF